MFQDLIAIGGHQDIRQLAGQLKPIQGVDKGCELLIIASGNRPSKGWWTVSPQVLHHQRTHVAGGTIYNYMIGAVHLDTKNQ